MPEPVAMNTGVPAQALKEAEAAEKLYKELYPDQFETPPVPDEPINPLPPELPAQPVPPVVPPIDQVVTPLVEAPPVEISPDDSTPPKPDEYEQRYKTLQGKYNKEVPVLASQLAQINSQLAAVQAELAAVKSGQVTRPDKLASTLAALDNDPKIQHIKETLPDLYDAVALLVTNVETQANAAIEKLSNRVDTQEATVVKTQQERFWDDLDKFNKDWETIQRTPDFAVWIAQTDRYTGVPRRNLLLDASGKFDSGRTIAFFEDYLADQAPTDDTTRPPVPIMPSSPKNTPPIVPKTVGGKKPVDPGTKTTEYINASEVSAFYNDLQRNKYLGREAESDRLQAKYDLATVQGRIIPGR